MSMIKKWSTTRHLIFDQRLYEPISKALQHSLGRRYPSAQDFGWL